MITPHIRCTGDAVLRAPRAAQRGLFHAPLLPAPPSPRVPPLPPPLSSSSSLSSPSSPPSVPASAPRRASARTPPPALRVLSSRPVCGWRTLAPVAPSLPSRAPPALPGVPHPPAPPRSSPAAAVPGGTATAAAAHHTPHTMAGNTRCACSADVPRTSAFSQRCVGLAARRNAPAAVSVRQSCFSRQRRQRARATRRAQSSHSAFDAVSPLASIPGQPSGSVPVASERLAAPR